MRIAHLLLLPVLVAGVSGVLFGSELGIGYISTDPAGPGANTATFDIGNETGSNSSGDATFPVDTSLDISNILLTLNFLNGGVITEDQSQFTSDGSGGYTGNFYFDLDGTPISSVTLTGDLSPTTVGLYDSTMASISPAFTAGIPPSSGSTLQIYDLGVINASEVPEPGSAGLLILAFAALLFFFRKKWRSRRSSFAVCEIAASLLFVAGATAQAQVNLNVAAQPASGHAGVTSENLTGSGFPSGTIAPAAVTISLASACKGTAVASFVPSNVATVIGSSRRLSFTIPATVPAGTYAVSGAGTTSTGAIFTTSRCSSLTVFAAQIFMQSSGGSLTLNGVPFRFGGGNTYQLMYSPQASVNQALQTAVNNHLRIIRTWGWLDIGEQPTSSNPNGLGSTRGPQNGVYFQYWNGSAPAYNDGANGLEMLDYEIYKAGQLGLKLIIPFTNNWLDFGGMDQYVEWAGDQYHDQFYTDPKIRQWYKNWIAHLLNHVNTYSGIAYKDDPAIAIWELANEPRCSGNGNYPSSGACSTQTILSWIDDVAPYIKSIDPNHLVSVGDEGFFCTNPSSTDWTQNCSQGVDSVAFAEAPGIDLMGFHLYPEGWGETTAWAENFIQQHLAAAQSIGKPVYLGEYGLLSGNTRNAAYREWTDTILQQGNGAGALFWDLVPGEPGASSAEANGSFDLYDGAPLLLTLDNFAQAMTQNTELPSNPVADDQWANTPFNQPVTLTPLQNDVAYGGAAIDPNSIDLDPNAPGQQTSMNVYGGTFAVSGPNVVFTPSSGFNGSTQVAYDVADSNGNLSNTAYLKVTVQPSQAGSLTIESFELGTDGWGALSAGGGTVEQSTKFPTDGTHSLEVDVTSSGWFGVSFPSPLNVVGRPSLSIDVETTGMGGSAAIAFQSGSSYTWCQTQDPWPTLGANTLTTLTIPLDGAQLNCGGGSPDLTDIETVYIYLNGPGTFYLDYLRSAPAVPVTGAVELFSFETGTETWAPVNSPDDGTVTQTTAFHTDGNNGLEIDATAGDWFGGALSPPADLTGKTSLLVDLETTSAGTSTEISIESGPNYTWCQGSAFPYVNAGTSTTISIPLDVSQLTCYGDGKLYLDQIHVVNVYIGSAGTFYVDNVRAQ